MSDTALFVHAYPGVEATLQRHWPYLKRSGFDIFGVGREGGVIQWPESMLTKDIGPNGYISDGKLPERLVETYRWFLTDPAFEWYKFACVVEYDSIFLRPPPLWPEPACATLAGGGGGTFKTQAFYHQPWVLSKKMAKVFVTKADELLRRGDREQGCPDFFWGLVFQELGLTCFPLEGTFSRNSLDIEADRIMARDRIRAGQVWWVHGVKTPEMLAEILS